MNGRTTIRMVLLGMASSETLSMTKRSAAIAKPRHDYAELLCTRPNRDRKVDIVVDDFDNPVESLEHPLCIVCISRTSTKEPIIWTERSAAQVVVTFDFFAI